MSYSIQFLPPSQPQQPTAPRLRASRSHHNATEGTAASCHESRLYLDKLTEQQRALVKPLISRVEHWKGHCLCSFGKPLLQAKALVSRSPLQELHEVTTRQYQIFLFSNILVCCRKRSRPNSQGKDWTLKGRVFLKNLYEVQQIGDTHLRISYHGDDGSDTFTINFPRPALLTRWATVLEHFRERAAEPRALESGSFHNDLPPPAYYSPLPEYTSSSSSSLCAPPMERQSPLNTPLTSPPSYTPADSFIASPASSQYPCRPVMSTRLSTSSIGLEDQYALLSHQQDENQSFDSEDATDKKMTLSTQSIKRAYALVSAMATGPAIYQSLALLSICLYLTYLGISHRNFFLGEEVFINSV